MSNALGSSTTTYEYKDPSHETLETFPSTPHLISVVIDAPEFSSLCPKTGQPDWARIVVGYIPDKLCVESKSFKLYLGQYRMHGDFHEAVVHKITSDLVRVLDPLYLIVEGRFTPRGGIAFLPSGVYSRKTNLHIKHLINQTHRRMASIPNTPR